VDPANATGFDGYHLWEMFGKDQLLVRAPDGTTSKESMLCWGPYDNDQCPGDLDANGEVLSPVMALAGWGCDFRETTMTSTDVEEVFFAFWFEYGIKEHLENVISEMQADGLNTTQIGKNMKYVYAGLGIDLQTSADLADLTVSSPGANGVIAIPAYDQWGVQAIPKTHKQLMPIFDWDAWRFEEDCVSYNTESIDYCLLD